MHSLSAHEYRERPSGSGIGLPGVRSPSRCGASCWVDHGWMASARTSITGRRSNGCLVRCQVQTPKAGPTPSPLPSRRWNGCSRTRHLDRRQGLRPPMLTSLFESRSVGKGGAGLGCHASTTHVARRLDWRFCLGPAEFARAPAARDRRVSPVEAVVQFWTSITSRTSRSAAMITLATWSPFVPTATHARLAVLMRRDGDETSLVSRRRRMTMRWLRASRVLLGTLDGARMGSTRACCALLAHDRHFRRGAPSRVSAPHWRTSAVSSVPPPQ